MSDQYFLSPGLTSVIRQGGQSVHVATRTMGSNGGLIINPFTPRDQGIHIIENLYVNITGQPAATADSGSTVTELVPGQLFIVPPNVEVWVNAKTSGHRFTAIFSSLYTVQPPTPVPGQPGSGVGVPGSGTGEFPPGSVTGLTEVIPSYLYQQYTDDDDLWAFVAAQNEMQQDYVDTFNALNLPIYPGPLVSGKLLDWVGRGVYGMARPSLTTGVPQLFGPLNTWGCNWITSDVQWQGRYVVRTNIPDLTAITPASDRMFWTAQTANPSVAEPLTVSLPGLPSGTMIGNNDELRYFAGPPATWTKTHGKYLETKFGLNEAVLIGPQNIAVTSDDIYRRILTWHFYKGDGNYFSVRWLKRRVWRFLYGIDGWGPYHVDWWPNDSWIAATDQISVSLGANRNITIRFVLNNRSVQRYIHKSGSDLAFSVFSGAGDIPVQQVTGGHLLNMFGPNGFNPSVTDTKNWNIGTDPTSGSQGKMPDPTDTGDPKTKFIPLAGPSGIFINDIETSNTSYGALPFMQIFKEAVDSGVLELPYQFNYTVHIG